MSLRPCRARIISYIHLQLLPFSLLSLFDLKQLEPLILSEIFLSHAKHVQ